VVGASAVGAAGPETLHDGDYWSARRLLRGYGVQFPAAVRARGGDEAAKAAAQIGYPVVLKALGLAHKTEAGGVALGIADEAQLRAAYATMDGRVGAEAYVVEAMEPHRDGVELIMGVRRDPAFGPVAMVGLGGVTAELAPDVAVGLAPLPAEHAIELLRSLRGAALLDGWRGAPPADLGAAAEVLTALSRAGAEHPELSELEINPVLAHSRGAVALDARAVIRG
jgi:acyl-CoA synthetase (NDP forming)